MKQKQFFSIMIIMIVFVLITVNSCSYFTNQTNNQTIQSSEASSSITDISATEPTSPSKIIAESIFLNEIQVGSQLELVSESNIIGEERMQNSSYILGNGRAERLDGVVSTYEYSVNRSSIAILLDENETMTGRLLFYDGERVIEISSSASRFQLSYDGNSIAVLEEYNPVENCGKLSYFPDTNKPGIVISETCQQFFAVSPNGENIAYLDLNDEREKDPICRLRTVSEQTRDVGDNIIPIAVSNDGELVYGIRASVDSSNQEIQELWVFSEKKETKLGVFSKSKSQSFLFNEDCKQILFDSDEGISISMDGNEPIVIRDEGKLGIRSPKMNPRTYEINKTIYSSNFSATKDLFLLPFTVNVDQYTQFISYLDNNGDLNNIIKGNGFVLQDQSIVAYSPDVEALVCARNFLSDGTFELIKVAPAQQPVLYEFSSDAFVYYSLPDKDTFYKANTDGNEDSKLISDECDEMVRFERENDADLIYYLQKDPSDEKSLYQSIYYKELYVIEDVPGAVPRLISDSVGKVYAGDFGVYYLSLDSVSHNIKEDMPNESEGDLFDTNSLFYATDGESFQLIDKVQYKYCVLGG